MNYKPLFSTPDLALKYLETGKLKALLIGQHDSGNYEMVIQYPQRALIAPRVKATVEYLLEKIKEDNALHVSIETLESYAA